ncbi:hypothetical protein NM688_g3861 [Phlebia brevispora]|uniref:Uncharacterized protein n=1 Tax=Phlebia brevispora TaxID=194682 RepID=A0ACC1T4I6_9APHY|nr:hypothetical protein NM688_g3861 [Phlebia brevispora]
MSADGLCDACFSGVRHEGEPEGVMEKIGGIDCYVATPKGDYPKDKVILFLTDVFGIPLINNRLLADDFARNGIKTIIPDILNGDARSEFTISDPTFDRKTWVAAHGPESWMPVVDKVVVALTESGVTRIGTTGYCFGAPPALYLAFKNESHVTVLAHPSRLQVPEDLEKYRDLSKAPLLINSCEVDPAFPQEAQAISDEIFGGGKFAPGYERTYWDGCTHGFAVRGDLSNPKIKAGKEDCVDCVRGVRHEGIPEGQPSRLYCLIRRKNGLIYASGRMEEIAGIQCYVAIPSGEYDHGKAVLFLTDAFGLPLINNQASLLVDDFARNGFKTIMPDYLNGDPIIDFDDPNFVLADWSARHGPDTWRGVVDKVVAALKESGVTSIGCTGYCFGAQPAIYLALKNDSTVTVLSHPTRVACPDDLLDYKERSKAPLLINGCEFDHQFGPEKQALADEILGGGQFAPGYEKTYWEGCTHGFAVRGDLSNPKVKTGKEGAFTATVEFFKKYL